MTGAPADFRSDTVTRPTPEMREAIARAEVGDDVFGDDPTVRRLEELAASTLRSEAALFVPSGTMGNQIAVRVHTRPGDEVILEASSHSYLFEAGGLAALSGVQARPLTGPGGAMDLEEMEAAIRTANVHHPRTTLICVENTHNFAGGTVLPLAWHRSVRALADRRGLRVHLDGARLFNAAVAAGVPARELAATADSTMFCLSKGLGAPVGSMLVGSRAFIDEARRARKLFGGGMRQVGIIAAPGIVALTRMCDRLVEDHRRARSLWEGLRGLRGLRLDAAPPETNIVFGDVEPPRTAAALAAEVARRSVLVVATGPQRFRLVTHYDVDDAAVERALRAFGEALSAG